MTLKRLSAWLIVPTALVLGAGCEDEPAKPKRKFIVGETTQKIVPVPANPQAEKAKIVTAPKIVAKDPITLPGNAYVTIIGQKAMLDIKHAIDLYQAETGEFPKTYEEFMEQIVKKNNIRLPLLPEYQKFGYDTPSHSLVIIEYPH